MDAPTDPTHVELSEMICFDLYAASRAVTAVYRPLLADLGLTYPQYLVLVVLWREQSCSVKYLADTLHLDYGTVTPLLRRMEASGLLVRRRSAEDERSVEITLSTAGRRMRTRTKRARAAIRAAVGLSEEQFVALQATLRQLTASATTYAASA